MTRAGITEGVTYLGKRTGTVNRKVLKIERDPDCPSQDWVTYELTTGKRVGKVCSCHLSSFDMWAVGPARD